MDKNKIFVIIAALTISQAIAFFVTPPLTPGTTIPHVSPPMTPSTEATTTPTTSTTERSTTTTQFPTTTPPIHYLDPNWSPPIGPIEEHDSVFWTSAGQSTLQAQLAKNSLNKNRAKNIIVIVADGMSIATQMAARMYISSEEYELAFEKFPYTGLSKTYCVNHQVADSACTATALFSGIKNNYGVLGLPAKVNLSNCTAQQLENDNVPTVMKMAQDLGMSTGIVTNTRITHATPAALYARSADREWENDAVTPNGCQDIADQLINGDVGKKINVILGGGRREFFPRNVGGRRTDGRNLIHEYLNSHQRNGDAEYVASRESLLSTRDDVKYLMGLFHDSHLEYQHMKDPNAPTMTEMALKAVKVLESHENGYFLMIESGRIDHAHHDTEARAALHETAELDKMVEAVVNHVNIEDTLIVLTADHSHTMTVGGYPFRGNDILAMGDFSNEDGMPLYTLNYANGMGHFNHFNKDGGRINPVGRRSDKFEFLFPATVPLDYETHGGDDVGVFAIGPWSHLFTGTYEQNYIAHAIMYAGCLGDGLKPDVCQLK